MLGQKCVIIEDMQFGAFASPFGPLCYCDRHQEMSAAKLEIDKNARDATMTGAPVALPAYLLTPLSTVSSTSVDASCTNVRALALEKPEIADDSESEDRREWDMCGTTKRGPIGGLCVCVCDGM